MFCQCFDRRDQGGFTLLELLIALLIFAVGLLGIAGLQGTAILHNATSNTRSVAVAVAEGAMEELLSRPADDPIFDANSSDEVYDLSFGDDTLALTVEGGGTYSATRTITVDTPTEDMVQVDVTVTGPQPRPVTVSGFKRVL